MENAVRGGHKHRVLQIRGLEGTFAIQDGIFVALLAKEHTDAGSPSHHRTAVRHLASLADYRPADRDTMSWASEVTVRVHVNFIPLQGLHFVWLSYTMFEDELFW